MYFFADDFINNTSVPVTPSVPEDKLKNYKNVGTATY